jgi:hypothetical protein
MDKNQILKLHQYLYTKLTKSKLQEQPAVKELEGIDFFSDVNVMTNTYNTFFKSKETNNMLKIELDKNLNLSVSLDLSDFKDAEYFVSCLDVLITTARIMQKLIEVIVKDFIEENKINTELCSSNNLRLISAEGYLQNIDEDEVQSLTYYKEVERTYFEWWVANSSMDEIKNNFDYPEEGCIVEGILGVIKFYEDGENKPFKIK